MVKKGHNMAVPINPAIITAIGFYAHLHKSMMELLALVFEVLDAFYHPWNFIRVVHDYMTTSGEI